MKYPEIRTLPNLHIAGQSVSHKSYSILKIQDIFQCKHSKITYSLLTVNGIWGWRITLPNRRKICEENGKCNQYDFLQVLSKSSWTTFKTIFETLSAHEACHSTNCHRTNYWRACIQEIHDSFEKISASF